MNYAGFWVRLNSLIVDGLLLAPLLVLSFFIQSISQVGYFAVVILGVVFYPAYFVYFNGKWGATPGKMIKNIKIVSENGEPISYKKALLRYLPEFLVALPLTIVATYYTMQVSPDLYAELDVVKLNEHITEASSGKLPLLNIVLQLWFVAAAIVLIVNKKKRTIHDFIAGTVVTRLEVKKDTKLSWSLKLFFIFAVSSFVVLGLMLSMSIKFLAFLWPVLILAAVISFIVAMIKSLCAAFKRYAA